MDTQSGMLPPHLVLYDGVCGFCDRTVQRLLKLDRAGQLRFAPLQGATAAAIRQRHPEIVPDLESIVLVESRNGSELVSWRSEATFRIADVLGLKSPMLAALRWLPHWCADLGYRVVASLRYRIWGKLDACRLPSPEIAERFLP